ncbi:MAG TPA: EboA domain-containing protein [Mycobacteriales bacterium]
MTSRPIRLEDRLTPSGREWWAATLAAAADPAAVRRAFPAVGRRLGRGPLDPAADPADPHAWTIDDAARAELLRAAAERTRPIDGGGSGELGALLDSLYTHGEAAERRGVLRALDVLPPAYAGDTALALLRDALRTNDVRLVAAAAGGPTAARILPDDEIAQALLKCLFVGVPLGGVAAVPERVTPDAARMVADFARERVAAGRDVPADAWLVLDRHPRALEAAGIAAELDSPAPGRRAAARRFLGSRPAAPPPRPRQGAPTVTTPREG